ncbi:MAG TPA: FixH family protein [Thermoanaerobaculia bacterium]
MHLRFPSPRGRGGLRRPLLGLALGLAACMGTAGCRQPAPDAPEIALAWTVSPAPPTVGAATFALTLTDEATGQPVQGAKVRLEGNMSHAGMKPVFSTAREVDPGRYRAPLELTMAGDWLILIDATLRDGRTLRRQAELPGVGAR